MPKSQQARTSHVSIPKGTWYNKCGMTLRKGESGARNQQEMLMTNRLYTHSPSCMNSCGRTSDFCCAGQLREVRLAKEASVGGEMGDQTIRNPLGFAT